MLISKVKSISLFPSSSSLLNFVVEFLTIIVFFTVIIIIYLLVSVSILLFSSFPSFSFLRNRNSFCTFPVFSRSKALSNDKYSFLRAFFYKLATVFTYTFNTFFLYLFCKYLFVSLSVNSLILMC